MQQTNEIILAVLAHRYGSAFASHDLDQQMIRGDWCRDSNNKPIGFVGFDYKSQRWLKRGWFYYNKESVK